jgi:hypothetical protein
MSDLEIRYTISITPAQLVSHYDSKYSKDTKILTFKIPKQYHRYLNSLKQKFLQKGFQCPSISQYTRTSTVATMNADGEMEEKKQEELELYMKFKFREDIFGKMSNNPVITESLTFDLKQLNTPQYKGYTPYLSKDTIKQLKL